MRATLRTILLTATMTASAVSAQSASVQVQGPTGPVSPGTTVQITLAVTFDTAGAPAGIFGGSGLHGFGGELVASGPTAGDITAAAPTVATELPLGVAESIGSPPVLVRAAGGRAFEGGITASPSTVLAFDLVIDPNASSGEIEIGFDGAIVLVLGDTLATFSTDPGLNQSTLTTTPITLTIGGRLCADSNNNGVADPGDFTAWVAAYNGSDLVADVNQNGVTDPGDFTAWVAAYNLGPAGPVCTP
ncbi:MAG: hypothetical protein ACTS22_03890 [Phycisphaerales bacterium]